MKSKSAVTVLPEHAESVELAAAASRSWIQGPMFWRPNYLSPSAWLGHLPFAFWIMHAHRPRVFVELGVHYGASYFGFCQAASRLGLDTSCYGIDTFKGDVHCGEYDGSVFEQVKKQNDTQYSGFSTILRNTFDDALAYFQNASIDLLHIDGMHSFDAVRADFESWLPKLSPRAVVLMHDTNVRERGFGVARMFQDLSARYPHFEFIHGHGLGILGVGKEQTALMRDLFALSKDDLERQAAREAFARLGQGCVEAFQAKESERKAAGWNEQAELRDKQLKYVQQCLEKSRMEVDELTAKVATLHDATHAEREKLAREKGSLEGKLELLDAMRRELMDEIVQQRSGMESSQASLARHAAEIETLREANHAQEAACRDLEIRCADTAARLEAALQERDALAQAAGSSSEREKRLVCAVGELEKNNRDLSDAIVLFQSENSKLKSELAGHLEKLAHSNRVAEEAETNARTRLQEVAAANGRSKQLEQELSQEKALGLQLKTELSSAAKKAQDAENAGILQLNQLRRESNKQMEALASENGRLVQDLKKAQARIEELDRELEERMAQSDRSQEIESLASRHAEQMKQIGDELESYKAQLNERFSELAELTKMLEEQNAVLKNKDNHAAVMASSIEELRKRYEQGQDEIIALKNEIRAKTASLEDRFREVALLTQVVQQRETELHGKNEELNLEKERAAHFRDLLEAQTGQESAVAAASEEPEAAREEPLEQKSKKRRARISRLSVATQISLLEKSELLDEDWYLEQYEDVAKSGMRPAEHYVRYGAAEGRQPGPEFDTSWYVTNYPDVAETGVNPAVHYLKYGKKEGRTTYSINRG